MNLRVRSVTAAEAFASAMAARGSCRPAADCGGGGCGGARGRGGGRRGRKSAWEGVYIVEP
jgi:hypothetical protein